MSAMFLKLIGGLLLLWIAIKLVVPSDEHGEGSVQAGDTLWRAVWLVTVADIVMSLDNVIAIAAAAETAAMRVDAANAFAIKTTLIVFGLATSVPLIIAGSALLMQVMARYPILRCRGGSAHSPRQTQGPDGASFDRRSARAGGVSAADALNFTGGEGSCRHWH
jgi:predicted tellurium resistance membrane protein TerC